jgi:hypothetical protein
MPIPRPNLLVLGASGNVARAFLRRLGGNRVHFGRLVLLDKNRGVLANRHLDPRRLDLSFRPAATAAAGRRGVVRPAPETVLH